jgi:GNAT superfamily N-acetyltransferase
LLAVHPVHASLPDLRTATFADSGPVSALIASLAPLFYASPDGAGADRFREATTPEALASLIIRPQMIYLVSEEKGVICGAVAIRERRHLLHLFVAPAFQRRGIGQQLWTVAREVARACGAREFTVNASLNAVAFYQKMGFATVGGAQQANGLVFQPMRLPPATTALDDPLRT